MRATRARRSATPCRGDRARDPPRSTRRAAPSVQRRTRRGERHVMEVAGNSGTRAHAIGTRNQRADSGYRDYPRNGGCPHPVPAAPGIPAIRSRAAAAPHRRVFTFLFDTILCHQTILRNNTPMSIRASAGPTRGRPLHRSGRVPGMENRMNGGSACVFSPRRSEDPAARAAPGCAAAGGAHGARAHG